MSVGGDLEISGAEVRLSGGGNLTVGGNLTHKSAASALAAGEVWVRAMPTNGTDGAVCGSRVEVKGNWTVGSYGGVFPVCDPTNGAVVALVARNFSLTNTAEISANNAGWGATRGKGGQSNWTGASHGGLGCSWSGGHYGVCYGDKRKPLLPGSGGSAGSGGGVIWLETLHEMILNGTLSANGANSGNYCGAGSGGSVYLFCNRMLGGTTGAITANGGSGCSLGGAGGGGRIAIRYRCAAPDCVISTVASGGTYSGKGESFQGEAGTVFRKRIGGMTILVR